MEINTFISNFAAQFDETDASEFYASKKFREIEEWNSLVALTIIAMADDEYHIKLTGENIRNSQTIEDIYNIIKSKK